MIDDLTSIADLSPDSVEEILEQAFAFKRRYDEGARLETCLAGKVVALIFEKPSLRTKVAFEIAAHSLGGQAVYLSSEQILASGGNLQGRESIPDVARNLERFCDLIVARVYHHKTIQELARSIKKPVINALCDHHHPTQALADLMAIKWHRGTLKGLTVSYVGDGNNVATSLSQIAVMMGMKVRVASPRGYEISKEEIEFSVELGKKTGGAIELFSDPINAVKSADIVYTDTFVSMGQEKEREKREKTFERFRVTPDLMKNAKKDALFMHCLPAHRGEEVSAEVIDGPQSVVFDQAECRLHIAKALLTLFLRD